MSFLQKAATLAAMTFALAGMTVQSSAVSATQLASSAGVAASIELPVVNVPVEPMVPAVVTIQSLEVPVSTPSDAIQPGDTVAYPTLAAAVAAQQASAVTEELRCLATAIYHESKGEPLAGQLAVAEVIINRSTSGRFPPEVCDVVTQRGQFSFVRGGRLPNVAENAAYRTAVAVAKVAMADAWNSSADRALYFNTPNRAPGARLTRVAAIGNHVFYR